MLELCSIIKLKYNSVSVLKQKLSHRAIFNTGVVESVCYSLKDSSALEVHIIFHSSSNDFPRVVFPRASAFVAVSPDLRCIGGVAAHCREGLPRPGGDVRRNIDVKHLSPIQEG